MPPLDCGCIDHHQPSCRHFVPFIRFRHVSQITSSSVRELTNPQIANLLEYCIARGNDSVDWAEAALTILVPVACERLRQSPESKTHVFKSRVGRNPFTGL